ncbi:MAG: PorT family protein [Bacteroidales bacterium]|nr:PorT family protein [Bacteroidales bacterium]
MTNKDWTDKLPELLDSYVEAEPEGLWDAVQAGLAPGAAPDAEPRRRHVIATWWYAGGALLAAAAISAVFFLWPSRPSVPAVPSVTPVAEVTSVPEITVVPGEMVANVNEISPRASLGRDDKNDIVLDNKTVVDFDDKTVISSEVEKSLPPSSAPPAETLPEEAPVTHEEPPQAVPQTFLAAPKQRRVPSLKVQMGLSTTNYFGQMAMNTTAGVGFPENPGIRPDAVPATKANSTTSANTAGVPKMLSRNKASTTDATHSQSLRTGIGLAIDITEHWGVETGIIMSTLSSHFNTTVGDSREYTTRTLYYRGIPLYARYNALRWERFSLYFNAGPMYEYLVRSSTDKDTYVGSRETGHTVDNTNINDSIWSLNAGAGLQLRIFNHGALYVLPGASYHFPAGSSIESFYTEHPLSYSVTFGFNFLF